MAEPAALVAAAVEHARRRGAACEAWSERRTSWEQRSSDGDLHHSAARDSLTTVVTTWRDGHEGCAVAGGADGIEQAVDAALALGAILPPSRRVPRDFPAGLAAPSTASGHQQLPQLRTLSASSELVRDVTLDAYRAVTAFGESGGALLERQTARSVVQVRLSTGTGAMSRSYVAREPADALQAAQEALPLCLRQTFALGSPSSPGPLPPAVVLHGSVMSRLLSLLAPSLQLDSVAQGKSRLAGRLGETVAADGFNLVDDGPFEFPFDDEGTLTRRIDLISGGRLLAFLSDVRTAASHAATSTGSGWRSSSGGEVRVRPCALLAGWAAGVPVVAPGPVVHVLQATGMHISNDVTGDFSFGAVGVIDDGTDRLLNAGSFTVAGNVVEMLAHLRPVPSPIRYVPRSVGLYGSPDIGVSGLVIGR